MILKGGECVTVSVALAEADMQSGTTLRELWTNEEVKVAGEVLTAKLSAHGCVVYKMV